jgi:hypothetical protein
MDGFRERHGCVLRVCKSTLDAEFFVSPKIMYRSVELKPKIHIEQENQNIRLTQYNYNTANRN